MNLRRTLRNLAVFTAALPAVVFAWGDTGHRVVCQIAFEELTDTARGEVEHLLSLDPDFVDFAESCLFADIPERIRMLDHFMNVPRSYRAITTGECPLADSCVISAIRGDLAVLGDPASSDADKLLALKLLGHWVGDIHQPLHIAYQDDRGANYIDVDLDMPDANLHGVWDYSIIAANLGQDYLRIAAELRGSISDWQRVDWQDDSLVAWANESYQITIAPSVGYCVRKQGACWYSEDTKLLSTGEPRRRMAISDDYLRQHKAIVSKRLKQAGLRLAALLERSLQ